MNGATAAGELRLESCATRVRRRQDDVALWFLLFSPVLLLALGFPLALAAVTFAIVRIVHGVLWSKARPALVVVKPGDSGELVIERGPRHYRIDKARITDCWRLPNPRTGRVYLLAVTPRSVISIQVPDRASANALSRALGADTVSSVVGMRLVRFPKLQRLWVKTREQITIFVPPFLPFVVLFSFQLMEWNMRLMPLAVLAIVPVISIARRGTNSRVSVGRDGLLITGPGRSEFIGFERVRAVSQSPLGIIVTLSSGDEIALPLAPLPRELLFFKKLHPAKNTTYDPNNQLARRAALAQRIDRALARFRDTSSDTGSAAARLLDRGSRPISEWREALSRDAGEAYREQRLDADQLVNVLENPKSPIGQRLGAAFALGAREHQARAHTAIAASANPKVRILLEKAAEGSLDEADYELGLEAEAEARRPSEYQPIRSN